HQRDTGGAVGEPAEDRLADESGRRPRRDHQTERAEVDPLLREVDRQDGQQPPEAEPHDELGDEQREDRAPAVDPGAESVEHRTPERTGGGPAPEARSCGWARVPAIGTTAA